MPVARPGTRYAEPAYNPPLTLAECDALCKVCKDPLTSHGLGDSTFLGCIELDLPFNNKKRIRSEAVNAALAWTRKARRAGSSGPIGQRTSGTKIADVARMLHHFTVAPGQKGMQFERCRISQKCCNPNHFVAVRSHGGTPRTDSREADSAQSWSSPPLHGDAEVSASAAPADSPSTAPTPVPTSRSDRGASPDPDSRVTARQLGSESASFGIELGCDEELPMEDTTTLSAAFGRPHEKQAGAAAAVSDSSAATRRGGPTLRYPSFKKRKDTCAAAAAAAAAAASAAAADSHLRPPKRRVVQPPRSAPSGHEEVLPSATTTRSGRVAGAAWSEPRFEAGSATRPNGAKCRDASVSTASHKQQRKPQPQPHHSPRLAPNSEGGDSPRLYVLNLRNAFLRLPSVPCTPYVADDNDSDDDGDDTETTFASRLAMFA